MTSAQYRHYGCRIIDDLVYKGMRTLYLENDLVRVGILLDKGADIFEFLYKPTDTDFLWRSPNGLLNPQQSTPTIASSSGAFLDNYHGGWQEIFPGGGPFVYQGAEIGLHGEVTQLGWKYTIVEDSAEVVSIRLSVDTIRMPFHLERVLRLERGKEVLFIEETLTNLSPEDVPYMWGHHPAFGAPFLQEGVKIFVPAQSAQVHFPKFAESGIFTPGLEFDWPHIPVDKKSIDLSVVPGEGAGFADLLYLKELSAGWFALHDLESEIGFGLAWPLEIFPYLWFWLVYGKAPGYPWWDRVYCLALEPWTSIPNSFEKAQETGRVRILKGGTSIHIKLTAVVIRNTKAISQINLDGTYK